MHILALLFYCNASDYGLSDMFFSTYCLFISNEMALFSIYCSGLRYLEWLTWRLVCLLLGGYCVDVGDSVVLFWGCNIVWRRKL